MYAWTGDEMHSDGFLVAVINSRGGGMYLWVSSMVGIICRTVAGEVEWLEGWQLKWLL
jgi:hypothetical protein